MFFYEYDEIIARTDDYVKNSSVGSYRSLLKVCSLFMAYLVSRSVNPTFA